VLNTRVTQRERRIEDFRIQRAHHESGRTNQPRTLNTNTPIAVLYIYDLVFMYPCRAGAAFTSASMSMHTDVTQQATRSIVSLLLIL
jgi:hypothetical protein